MGEVTVSPASGKRDMREFVDVAYRLNAGDPNWVANLRMEEVEKFTPVRCHTCITNGNHSVVQCPLQRFAEILIGHFRGIHPETA